MKKHAYLIIIHQNTFVVQTLLRMLDDSRNDIYIHIDKKSRNIDEKSLSSLVKQSKVYFVKRENVYWGNISLVRAEYNLFSSAYSRGGYSYYHLLSGADLPIKTQDEIHGFFDRNQGKEFIGFSVDEMADRVVYRWLFPKHLRGLCTSRHWIGRKVNVCQEMAVKWFLDFQKKHHLNITTFPIYRKGSEWVSLTESAVRVLLKYRKKVLHSFRFANCPDEHYKQTILYNYYEQVRNQYDNRSQEKEKGVFNDVRLLGWGRGTLDFTISDWQTILDSPKLFCRKIADEKLAAMILERFGPQ